jgi:hypothetical protein
MNRSGDGPRELSLIAITVTALLGMCLWFGVREYRPRGPNVAHGRSR